MSELQRARSRLKGFYTKINGAPGFDLPNLGVLLLEAVDALDKTMEVLARVEAEQTSMDTHLGEVESRLEDLEEPDE